MGVGPIAPESAETLAKDPAFLSRYGSSRRGIWRPQGWGTNLRAAVQTTQPVIGLLGDSVTRGYYASDLGPTSSNTSWAGKLRTYLQGLYGDGGSGFHGSRDNATAHANLSAYTLPVTLTGTWADYLGTDGPGSQGMQCNTTGSTMTTTVRGSTVKVYYITVSSGGTMDIAVDGATAESVDTAGSNGVGIYTKSGLSTGTHQIVITKTATDTGYVFILGFSGTNDTGLIVHNFARTGGNSAHPATNASYGGGQWAGGNLLPCDLIIYGYGVNDAASNVAIDTYTANVRRYLAGVVDIANANKPGLGNRPTTPDPKNGAVDIMFHMPHVGKWEGASEFYPEYLTRVRGLAETFGAAVLDEWTIYRNSWNYFNSLSGWGQANGSPTPGATGTDSVHPSDIGHNLYYLNVKSVIDEALAYAA